MKETFESQILANLDDREAYQVYSDWLTEQNDPRGEFIRIQLQLQDNPEMDRLQRFELEKREKKLFSETWKEELANITRRYEHIPPPQIEFTWGFPSKILAPYLTHDSAKLIASAKATRFVREIEVGSLDSVYDLQDVEPGKHPSALFELLESENLGNLRSFKLGETQFDEGYYNCETLGFGVVELLQKFGQLSDVRLAARSVNAPAVFALPLTNLSCLHLMHEYDYPVSVLAENAAMSNLEEIAILPHALEYGDEPYLVLSDLRAVCESPHLRKLKRLCFRLTDMRDDAAGVIVDSDVLDHLQELDLANGSLSDEGARILVSDTRIKNLKRMNFNKNALTGAGIEMLKATGVEVLANDQHERTEDTQWLYEGDIE